MPYCKLCQGRIRKEMGNDPTEEIFLVHAECLGRAFLAKAKAEVFRADDTLPVSEELKVFYTLVPE